MDQLHSCLSLSFFRHFAGNMSCEGIFHVLINNFLNVFRKVIQEKSLSPFGPVTQGGGGPTRLVTNGDKGGG